MTEARIRTARTATALAIAACCAVAAPAAAEPVRYVVEPNHTFVNFEVVHFKTSTVRGRFDRIDGFVVLDRAAKTGQAEITIDTGSVSSGIGSFDAHLKNADFLDVPNAPQARFVGRDFRFDGDRLVSVSGDLVLLGKTAPVTLTATRFNCYDSPIVKAPVCGGDFETEIRRSRWGMHWGIENGVPDTVRLLIQIEAIRKQ